MNNKYRKGVGAIIINQDKKIWVGSRIDMPTIHWQMPQGGIDNDELPKDAVLREIEEETGIKTNNLKLLDYTKDWLQYDLPKNLIPQFWQGKYRGQKQIWYIFKFTGLDNDININTKNPEFHKWQWLAKDEVIKHIVTFKKELYIKLIETFNKHLIK